MPATTIPLASIEASKGFWELADPAKRLKDSIQKALQDGSLELWLMGSRPPTPEECRIGYQFLRAGTDDMPVADTLRWVTTSGNPYAYNLPTQLIYLLSPEDWLPLHTAVMASAEPSDVLMSIIPATAAQGGSPSLMVGRTNRSLRYAGGIQSDDRQPMQIRWALLRSGGGMGPHETTWTTSRERGTYREVSSMADGTSGPVVVDFRDGIPLTVGPRDSNANVRIGEIHRWTPRAEIFSIHVPLPITSQGQ